MRDSGLTANVMVMESKNGLMVLVMKEIGEMVRPMEWVNCTTQMVIFTRESGKMIKLTEMEHTLMPMAQNTLDSGKMTNSMDKD